LQVATVAGGKLAFRDVTLGRNLGNEIEVLSGVAANDTVVLAPNALLTDGSAVNAKPLAPAKKP